MAIEWVTLIFKKEIISETGMPFGTVNLRYGVHRGETPVTCTAGVGTFIVG